MQYASNTNTKYHGVQQKIVGEHMATSSYYEDLILDTPEAIANMEKAFERAERGEVNIPYEKVELCCDPDVIRRILKG